MKSKTTAALLAFFLGGIGIHYFYLGKSTNGILALLFCWTFIPSIIAFINFIQYLTMSEEEFNRKFNGQVAMANATKDVATEIGKLHDLRSKGAITEEEYEERKKKLLV
jgi:TM2 domain-containing membrane protein YozV